MAIGKPGGPIELIVRVPDGWGWDRAFEDNIQFMITAVNSYDDMKLKIQGARDFLREKLKERHYTIVNDRQFCGAPIGTSIDTCIYCKEWRMMLSDLITTEKKL